MLLNVFLTLIGLEERHNYALPLIKGMIQADPGERLCLDKVKESLMLHIKLKYDFLLVRGCSTNFVTILYYQSFITNSFTVSVFSRRNKRSE